MKGQTKNLYWQKCTRTLQHIFHQTGILQVLYNYNIFNQLSKYRQVCIDEKMEKDVKDRKKEKWKQGMKAWPRLDKTTPVKHSTLSRNHYSKGQALQESYNALWTGGEERNPVKGWGHRNKHWPQWKMQSGRWLHIPFFLASHRSHQSVSEI